MRLITIRFEGYKRLRSTSCNVDGKLVAFLGPNESGKSSVLEGLHWLTAGDDTPAPSYVRTRGENVTDDTPLVSATFVVDEHDTEAIKDIDLEPGTNPRQFMVERLASGRLRTRLTPQPRRPDAPVKRLRTIAVKLNRQLTDSFEASELMTEVIDGLSRLIDITSELEEVYKEAHVDAFQSSAVGLTRLVKTPEADLDVRANVGRAGAVRQAGAYAEALQTNIQQVLQAISQGSPYKQIQDIYWKRSPDFLLFSEQDRMLQTSYDLADDGVRTNPPRALENLLNVSGTNIAQIHGAIVGGDTTMLKTLLRKANERLQYHFTTSWRQSALSVQLDTDNTRIQVLITELAVGGSVTAFHERSDGLRIFVALVSFLTARSTQFAPILLIDEAETHLHLNAQADLVSVLSNQEQADQILYTTHSPGCLPHDLGTGLRFVEPDPDRSEISCLRNDFWQSNEPGYSPLLYMMGAGAAAFSACRNAVLCEGPSEMILLPSLLRAAVDVKQLDYQVAPGLASFSGDSSQLDEVGARIVYLTDGDSGGQALRTRLQRLGIPNDRIVSLSPGHAIEDYVPVETYFGAVAQVLRDSGISGPFPGPDDIQGTSPIAKAVEDWLHARSVKPPGKTIVASRIAQEARNLALAETFRFELAALHEKFTALFSSKT